MRVVSVVGPAQSGKTTLVEALASLEPGEAQRLTLAGDVAVTKFRFMGEPWAALDCPGGPDSLAHVAPALAASDAAVLCVPADAEAAVLAAPYLRLLDEADLPTLLFVNRIDAATDRVSDIVSALQVYCRHGIVLRQVPMRAGGQILGAVDLISERAWAYREGDRSSLVELPPDMWTREAEARAELLEHLADFDDALLEQLIEDRQPMTEAVYAIATRALQHHDLVPALLGAASHGNGVLRLMKSLRHEVPGIAALRERLSGLGEAVAVACGADHVKHLGKTVLLRALTSGIAPGTRVLGDSIGSIVDIDAKSQLASLAEGEIGLTVKTDHLHLRTPVYLRDGAADLPGWVLPRTPNHRIVIVPASERDETRLSGALARLMEIDPGLSVTQDEQTGQAVLGTQGPLHLRRIVEKLNTVFGIRAETRNIPPALRETIARKIEKQHRHRKQSGGAGQFADVVIDIGPAERGSGFLFEEQIKGGVIPRAYIPAVEAGAREALVKGPQGYPVVDVSITLKDGKHHSVDSSDFAFRTAGRNAVREALAEAGTLVLQPIDRVRIQVPTVFSGGLVPLVSGLRGQVLNFAAHPSAAGWDEFNALLPEAAEAELFSALGSATRGTAWYSPEFDHFEELRGAPRSGAEAASGEAHAARGS